MFSNTWVSRLSTKGKAVFVSTVVLLAATVVLVAVFNVSKVQDSKAHPASSPIDEVLDDFPPVGVIISTPLTTLAPLTAPGVIRCAAATVVQSDGSYVPVSGWEECVQTPVAGNPNALHVTFPRRVLQASPASALVIDAAWSSPSVGGNCLFMRLISEENCAVNDHGHVAVTMPADLSTGLEVICPNGQALVPFLSVKSTRAVDGRRTYAFSWNAVRVPINQTSFRTAIAVYSPFTSFTMSVNVQSVSFDAWDGFSALAGVSSFAVGVFLFLWHVPLRGDMQFRGEVWFGSSSRCGGCCRCRSDAATNGTNDDAARVMVDPEVSQRYTPPQQSTPSPPHPNSAV